MFLKIFLRSHNLVFSPYHSSFPLFLKNASCAPYKSQSTTIEAYNIENFQKINDDIIDRMAVAGEAIKRIEKIPSSIKTE